jgi:hypothetical protein
MTHYSNHSPYGYTYHADIYCGQCGKTLPDIDPEGNDKHPIFSWELNELAVEGSQHCATCHEPQEQWWPAG